MVHYTQVALLCSADLFATKQQISGICMEVRSVWGSGNWTKRNWGVWRRCWRSLLESMVVRSIDGKIEGWEVMTEVWTTLALLRHIRCKTYIPFGLGAYCCLHWKPGEPLWTERLVESIKCDVGRNPRWWPLFPPSNGSRCWVCRICQSVLVITQRARVQRRYKTLVPEVPHISSETP